MKRHELQNKLHGQIGYREQRAIAQTTHLEDNPLSGQLGYWAERALAQLRYLEELNTAGLASIDSLLDEATKLLDKKVEEDGVITKSTALEMEKLLAPASKACKAITVECVGHAHIDMNWMWRFDETVSITIDTLRTMLILMDEYSEFTFSQSQASVYRIIEKYAPEMIAEIKKRIQEGRWEVMAATWVETDKNLPNGESLSRHLLYTKRYLKDLLGLGDDDFELDFEPDTFGHNINVPEILNSGGVKYMYHCRGYDGHNIYKYRSPSGKEITVFREPTWYIDAIRPQTFQYIPSFCGKHNISRMVHVYGVGNHGGGATRRDIERILDMKTWPCMPTINFGRLIDFFRYIEKANDWPVVDTELNFVFDGCYSSQTRIKKANRIAEASLFEAEAFNAFSHLCGGYPYSGAAYAQAWEDVLFNHFHDIIPGSGTIDTREHAMGLFQNTMAHAGTRKSAALRSLASMIDTTSMMPNKTVDKTDCALGGGIGFGVEKSFVFTDASTQGGIERLFTIFNPSQAAGNRNATLTVWDWAGDINKVKITDENGNDVPFEPIHKEQQKFWFHQYFQIIVNCDFKSFGYRTVKLSEHTQLSKIRKDINPRIFETFSVVLENDLVRAEFDRESFALVSYVNKTCGTEYVNAGQDGAMFRYIEEEGNKGMSSWTVGRYMSNNPVTGSAMITKPINGELSQNFTYEVNIKNSKLDVTVSLEKNSNTLRYDVKTDWREIGKAGVVIPQLAFSVPLKTPCKEFLYDIPCGTISREAMYRDVPAGSFAFASASKGGLLFVSDCKQAFRGWDNSISLTLIRSSYDPDTVPECYDHEFSFGLALINDNSKTVIAEKAKAFCHPPMAVTVGSQTGQISTSGNFLTVDKGNVLLSCVKIAEDADHAIIVRLYDIAGIDQDVSLSVFKSIQSAIFVDAHENPVNGNEPKWTENRLSFYLGAGETKAIMIML